MLKRLSILVCLVFTAQISFAAPFRIMGARATGVGGAYTAVAEGVDAQYWNPAALGVTTGSGIQFPVNANFEATGNLLEKADAISNAADTLKDAEEAQNTNGGLTLQEITALTDVLNKVLDLNDTGTGALAGASAGLQSRFGRLAVSFNQYGDAGLNPFVDSSLSLGSGGTGVTLDGDPIDPAEALLGARGDLAKVIEELEESMGLELDGNTSAHVANKLINDAVSTGLTSPEIIALVNDASYFTSILLPRVGSGTGDLSDNDTRINITGAAMSEISLGYGVPIMLSKGWGNLALGANLKALKTEVGFASIKIMDGEDSTLSDAIDEAKNTTKTSVKPSMDVGLLYRFPVQRRLQMGVVGRNINSPKFDTPAERLAWGYGEYQENAQYRAGMAFWPMKRWMLSGDIDLNKNKTSVPGFKSQTWGAGTEFKIWLLDLRAGLMKNFEMDTPLTYTGGFGLNFGAFKINAAGAVSSKTVKLEDDGSEVPASAQASLTIGFVFGQGQGGSKAKPVTTYSPEADNSLNATPASSSTPGDNLNATPASSPSSDDGLSATPAPSPTPDQPSAPETAPAEPAAE